MLVRESAGRPPLNKGTAEIAATRRARPLLAGVLSLLLAALAVVLGRQLPVAAEVGSFSVDQVEVQGLSLTLSGQWQPQGNQCNPNGQEHYSVEIDWGDGQETSLPLPCPPAPWEASHGYAAPGVYQVCAALLHVNPQGSDVVEAPCSLVNLGEVTATPTPSATATSTTSPTASPTAAPTDTPTPEPTATPSSTPTLTPSATPTLTATATASAAAPLVPPPPAETPGATTSEPSAQPVTAAPTGRVLGERRGGPAAPPGPPPPPPAAPPVDEELPVPTIGPAPLQPLPAPPEPGDAAFRWGIVGVALAVSAAGVAAGVAVLDAIRLYRR